MAYTRDEFAGEISRRKRALADRGVVTRLELRKVRFCGFMRVRAVPFRERSGAEEAALVAASAFESRWEPLSFIRKCRVAGYWPQLDTSGEAGLDVTLHRSCCGYGKLPWRAEE